MVNLLLIQGYFYLTSDHSAHLKMTLAQIYMLYLPFIMLVEIILLFIYNSNFAKTRIPDDGMTKKRIETTSNRSLTLTVAATAALAFLLRDISVKPELQDPVLLIGLSLVIFGTAFGMDFLAGRIQLFFDAQNMLIQMGLITLIAGLAFSYSTYFPGLQLLLSILIIALAMLQLWEYMQLMNNYGIARIHLRRAGQLENTGNLAEAAMHYEKAHKWYDAKRVRGEKMPQSDLPPRILR